MLNCLCRALLIFNNCGINIFMNTELQIQRKLVELTFSRNFESLLLTYPSEHFSLTHDLEFALERGLNLLSELEDVRDIEHIELVKELIRHTNQLTVMDAVYFSNWKLHVSEDLLDEIDLLLLTHGSDLALLGLNKVNEAFMIVLLAVAGCKDLLGVERST